MFLLFGNRYTKRLQSKRIRGDGFEQRGLQPWMIWAHELDSWEVLRSNTAWSWFSLQLTHFLHFAESRERQFTNIQAVKLSRRISFKCKMRLCTSDVHSRHKVIQMYWLLLLCNCSVLALFHKQRLTVSSQMCPTSSNYCFIQLLFIALHHSPPHPHPLLSEKHTHLCRIDENSHNRSGGSVMARAPPRGPGWGACLTSLWPYSVSPPAWCRLAPTWGGPMEATPPFPICLTASPASRTRAQHSKGSEGRGS